MEITAAALELIPWVGISDSHSRKLTTRDTVTNTCHTILFSNQAPIFLPRAGTYMFNTIAKKGFTLLNY